VGAKVGGWVEVGDAGDDVGGTAVADGGAKVGVDRSSGVFMGAGFGAQDVRKIRMKIAVSLFMTEPPFTFATSEDIGGCGLPHV
jgi:hypothetical protein